MIERRGFDVLVHYNRTMTRILAFETSTSTGTIALISEQQSVVTLIQRTIEGTTGHAAQILPMAYSILAECGLTKNDLDAVAFGQGPGAFTGVRVACGVAQGIGLALDIPVIAIGALPAVAEDAARRHPSDLLFVALDARMDEVYFGVYAQSAHDEIVAIQPPVLLSAEDVLPFVAQRQAFWQERHKESLIEHRAQHAQEPAKSPESGSANVRANRPSNANAHADLRANVTLVGEGWRLVEATQALPQAWVQDDFSARPEARAVALLALKAWKNGQTLLPEHAAPLYLRDKVAFTTLERARGDGGNPRAKPPSSAALLPMLRSDLHVVVAIEAAVQSFPWTLRNFEDALDAGYDAWVLRTADGIQGFCIVMMAPDVAHLLVIAVARDAQRLGYGKQMMEHLTRLARGAGTEGIVLEVRPSNQGALAFYLEEGFVQIGLRRDYYPAAKGQREDALILKKSFDEP
ncbi:tRNA (adenosine(37)-N6)-threonylcarbamoyltransferase complex dimerization subunit type 1 TsaB [Zwartia sp.]|uniref:tRNA (adenosine(37)-N6)-threonylcarbamoyltransferase complex dimerization subunit type 1 TsaB n=1 Tax=Zwartia sp. TaxID=2978004 RepID=UPI002722030F|nr:tRNA (adenosine(37)-N6)-threonylcarbamoyltransferase complex dimerization subunit type 1 TsaB [Zwartia sp.]MDO9023412.1 tRNA (adenosine(37)-N6)-threonylcarbamoyltransferase complex dimerization subunit type 1 TsaB [Zwartia sp.]